MKIFTIILVAFLSLTYRSLAWGNRGHEIVAYIAYQHLDPTTKTEVDSLLKLNPCFKKWTAAAAALPAEDRQTAIFVQAATWPDRIKLKSYDCEPGKKFIFDGLTGAGGKASEDIPPHSPVASQNIGYTDSRRHKYWHFVDMPFTNDGTSVSPPFTPNALTELMLLIKAIESNEAASLKSYDMVWIEHIIGDVHQPLHDTSRFTHNHPKGDQGGNLVLVCETPGCTAELHGYWDQLPGQSDNLAAAIATGKEINSQPEATDTEINVENPSAWITDGLALAKSNVYVPPISTDDAGSTPAKPDDNYATEAKKLARAQLFMAGQRLAQVLNNFLT